MKPLSPCAVPFAAVLFGLALSPTFIQSAGKDGASLESAHSNIKAELIRKAAIREANKALMNAALDGDKAAAEKALAAGASPNFKQSLDGNTPLHHAADNGHFEVVELLLDRGARPNEFDNIGGTPLSGAAAGGHVNVVRLLLERKAKPNLAGQLLTSKTTTMRPMTPYCAAKSVDPDDTAETRKRKDEAAKLIRERLGKDADLSCSK